MIDYSYVECSAACIQALCKWQKVLEKTLKITGTFSPNPRLKEVSYVLTFRRSLFYIYIVSNRQSITKGANFIKSIQRTDGSWFGSWGICFTYPQESFYAIFCLL